MHSSSGIGVAPKGLGSDLEVGRKSSSGSGGAERRRACLLLRVSLHVLGLLTVCSFGAYVLEGPTTVRGTFCNNTESALPYKKGSISLGQLMTLSFVAPSLLIILLELLLLLVRRTAREGAEREEGSECVLLRWRVPRAIQDLYRYLGGFGYTMAGAWLLSDTLKAFVGSLRPHFFDVCKPDWDKVTCKGENEEYIYVEDFHCTGNPRRIERARRSFPSGHSAYTACGMLFAILYLQARLRWHAAATAPTSSRSSSSSRGWVGRVAEKLFWSVQALLPLLQLLLLLLALYVPATRVLEHYHHVRDVCAGAALGSLVALFGAFFLVDLRKP